MSATLDQPATLTRTLSGSNDTSPVRSSHVVALPPLPPLGEARQLSLFEVAA